MKFLRIQNSEEKIAVGKILCVGKNYSDHAKEMGGSVPSEPMIFSKHASTLIFNGDKVKYPAHTTNLHYEGELVLFIGKNIGKCSLEEAEDSIAGYAAGLDMTLRDLQKEFKEKGQPWTLSKCFDTSAVLSDVILKSDYKIDFTEKLILEQNGEVKQDAQLGDMVFKPATIVQYIAERITLQRGDLIYTGTPSGVGSVDRGDKLLVRINNLPLLKTEII